MSVVLALDVLLVVSTHDVVVIAKSLPDQLLQRSNLQVCYRWGVCSHPRCRSLIVARTKVPASMTRCPGSGSGTVCNVYIYDIVVLVLVAHQTLARLSVGTSCSQPVCTVFKAVRWQATQ
jgi:hypothetical protein